MKGRGPVGTRVVAFVVGSITKVATAAATSSVGPLSRSGGLRRLA
jgi:hypothetical protein